MTKWKKKSKFFISWQLKFTKHKKKTLIIKLQWKNNFKINLIKKLFLPIITIKIIVYIKKKEINKLIKETTNKIYK